MSHVLTASSRGLGFLPAGPPGEARLLTWLHWAPGVSGQDNNGKPAAFFSAKYWPSHVIISFVCCGRKVGHKGQAGLENVDVSGPCSREGSRGRLLPGLFQLWMVPGIPWLGAV